MEIKVFRIDDRLIHGQIVTAWMQYADAEQIVVIDDAAASSELKKKLLRMATPKNIELQVLSVEEGKKALESDDNKKTLLLVGGPQTALDIIDNIKDVKSINIGNLNMKKGKTRILDGLWVFESDIEAFKQLEQKGIECEFRIVPSDRSLDAHELIRKI